MRRDVLWTLVLRMQRRSYATIGSCDCEKAHNSLRVLLLLSPRYNGRLGAPQVAAQSMASSLLLDLRAPQVFKGTSVPAL